ncbi:MAG: tetratricopeptide repeat protein [Patescibacteria group bacterium]
MKYAVIILILVGALIYGFNVTGQLLWDDIEWIATNPFVHSFSWDNIKHWFSGNVLEGIGLSSNYYRPFLFATFTFNYVMHGVHPVGWHVVSNLIHIANAILLVFLLMRLFGNRFLAFWVGLIFLVHPLQTEAVTYISGRGDPLAALFMLSALLLFLRGRRVLPLVFLVLALLSRETAIMFPFLLMIVLIVQSKETFWRSLKKSFFQALPYVGVVTAYGILRLTVLNFDNTLNFFSSAVSNPYTQSVFVRLITFLSILPTYGRLLLVPLGLHMDRAPAVYTSLTFWEVWVPLVVLLGLLYVTYTTYRSHRTYAGVLFFGIAWFFAAISPMSGITPINAIMYEHWLYVPLIGPFTIIVYFLSRISYRKAVIAVLVLLTAWFSYLAIQRNRIWSNPIALFEDILRYEPMSARALTNAANLYFEQGDTAMAEAYYRRAIATNTSFPQAYYNLARLHREQGRYTETLPLLRRALDLDPGFFYAYQELAIVYAHEGDFIRSRDALLALRELRPQDPRVYLNLGKVEQALGNTREAIRWLTAGLPLSESDLEAHQEIQALLDQLAKKR